MEYQDRLDRIYDAVCDSAREEAKKLIDAANKLREERLAEEKLRLAAEIDAYTQRESMRIKADSANTVNMFAQENRKKLIEAREQYIKKVFGRVEEKIVRFTSGYKYELYLRELYISAADALGESAVFWIRAVDTEIAARIAPGRRFEISSEIQYGGLIAESGRLVADLTIDRKLKEAKEHFISSGAFAIDA